MSIPPLRGGVASGVPIGVYRGRGCGIAAIERYESFCGRQCGFVVDFMEEAPTSWGAFETGALTSSASVAAWSAGVLGTRRLALGVPACVLGTTWAQEAAGVNDAHWKALGEHLVNLGLGNALLRIGREFNGSWYGWKVTEGGQATYISGYQHVVSTLRAVPGAAFRFCWNPILGVNNFTLQGTESCYPGNAYVDEIGVDAYDGDWTGIYGGVLDNITTGQQQRVFDSMLTEWDSLRGWYNLARAHGKPLSFPEWGLRLWKDFNGYHGGGDNAVLVAGMADFVAGCGASWHAMWEDPWGAGVSDPDTLPSRTCAVPMARAAFLAGFAA